MVDRPQGAPNQVFAEITARKSMANAAVGVSSAFEAEGTGSYHSNCSLTAGGLLLAHTLHKKNIDSSPWCCTQEIRSSLRPII